MSMNTPGFVNYDKRILHNNLDEKDIYCKNCGKFLEDICDLLCDDCYKEKIIEKGTNMRKEDIDLLEKAWKKSCKLTREGEKLRATGRILRLEGKGAEGFHLVGNGNVLRAQAKVSFDDAIEGVFGMISITWLSPYHCTLKNGMEFKSNKEQTDG